jgi:hypothetical protein
MLTLNSDVKQLDLASIKLQVNFGSGSRVFQKL